MLIDTIHCFYLEIGWSEHFELLQYWKERWQKEGWKTKVFGIDDSKMDARFDRMVQKSKDVPCVNARDYEMANFIRWLAFSQIDGAVADFDVFPTKPFPPAEFSGFYSGSPTGCPSFIVGSRSDFSKVADTILSYEVRPDDVDHGNPHVSDMSIIYRNTDMFSSLNRTVMLHTEPGWEQGPLVHFNNDSMVHLIGSKTHKIRTILSKIYP